ncbi:MAG: right-handed parallel beta-helix repeat-containing protein, partial [Candidatus Odinarchaeota archaeon]
MITKCTLFVTGKIWSSFARGGRMQAKKKIFTGCLFILVMMLFPSFHGFSSNGNVESNYHDVTKLSGQGKLAGIQASPIVITDNSGFTTAGFNGSGIASDPYVLKGISIDAGGPPAINITHTDAHFRIENVIINGSTNTGAAGIYLENVTNGEITGNIITHCFRGVDVIRSTVITVENNAIASTLSDGICFRTWSNHSTIAGNTLTGTGASGIYLYFVCHYFTITKNTILNTGTHGIYTYYICSHNMITDNTIADTGVTGTGHGIWLRSENYNYTVTGNVISRVNGDGLRLYWFYGSHTIVNNSITDVAWSGMWLGREENNNNITGNTITNAGGNGIYMEACVGNVVERNAFLNCSYYGMNLNYSITWGSANDTTVSWNTFLHNNGGGVQGYDNGTNNLFDYNHWNDHVGPDVDVDGFADAAYPIDGIGTQDDYPRVAPVWINEDSDFGDFASEGNGSEDSPYLLEKLLFTSSKSTLIHVANTTAHFVIQNNELDGLDQKYPGIYLKNVTNGVIHDNRISHCSNGIFLNSSCSNNSLSLNRVELNANSSFYLVDSDNNTLYENYAGSNAGSGFILLNCHDNNLTANVAFYNTENGFDLIGTRDTVITRNNASYNENGLKLTRCIDAGLTDNEASKNANNGFLLVTSNTSLMIFNHASKNGITGFVVSSSYNNNLSSNTASFNYNNGFELSSTSTSNILVNNNATRNALDGFLLNQVYWNSLTGNIGSLNGRNGIAVNSSGFSAINSNYFEQNVNYGIYLRDTSHNNLSRNIVSRNEGIAGVYLETSTYNTVYENSFWNNTDYGAYLKECLYNTFYFNVFILNGRTPQAFDILGSNSWTNGSHGNYWSDHANTDADEDGIIDIPYILDGAFIDPPVDQYPVASSALIALSTLSVTGPGDIIIIEAGTTDYYTISWTAVTNLYPAGYKIARDGSFIHSGSWTSGVAIEFEVDVRNWPLDQTVAFKIVVTDLSGHTVSDVVRLRVEDNTGPELIYNGETEFTLWVIPNYSRRNRTVFSLSCLAQSGVLILWGFLVNRQRNLGRMQIAESRQQEKRDRFENW